MRLTRACKSKLPEARDVSGIALFMVMSAIGMLSILVTEFSYIAQVNQRMAYDSLDQVKAHYLAKSGMKLSLLRLKAYIQLKNLVGTGSGNGNSGSGGGNSNNPLAGAIPKSVLDKVWSFPFIYPVPALPGMSISDKDALDEFAKSSSLEGHYTAVIESDSAKYDINLILPGYAPSSSPSPSPSPTSPTTPGTAPSPNPSAEPSFNPEQARKGLHDYLQDLINSKSLGDEDFAREYQGFRVDDFMDYLTQWADHSYQGQLQYPSDVIQPKHAPFYSMTELHQIPTLDDDLYAVFSEALTVSTTPGININSMQEVTLRALVPQMTNDEVAEFFKFRDDTTVDNSFKKDTDFFDYLAKNVGAFRGSVDQFKQGLQQRGIRLITDESAFKITVQAQVNQAVRTIEVWVTLTGAGQLSPTPGSSGPPTTQGFTQVPPGTGPQASPVPDTGLKIGFMRIL